MPLMGGNLQRARDDLRHDRVRAHKTGITQNQSESINFVMHSLLKWKEVQLIFFF